tara:strand:+ start:247 stop:525 length:279 start_codon:yes stop_codon:yes gene_type:complete
MLEVMVEDHLQTEQVVVVEQVEPVDQLIQVPVDQEMVEQEQQIVLQEVQSQEQVVEVVVDSEVQDQTDQVDQVAVVLEEIQDPDLVQVDQQE